MALPHPSKPWQDDLCKLQLASHSAASLALRDKQQPEGQVKDAWTAF